MENLVALIRFVSIICLVFSVYTLVKGDFLTAMLSFIYFLVLLLITFI